MDDNSPYVNDKINRDKGLAYLVHPHYLLGKIFDRPHADHETIIWEGRLKEY